LPCPARPPMQSRPDCLEPARPQSWLRPAPHPQRIGSSPLAGDRLFRPIRPRLGRPPVGFRSFRTSLRRLPRAHGRCQPQPESIKLDLKHPIGMVERFGQPDRVDQRQLLH
jgi:hypothetical protein